LENQLLVDELKKTVHALNRDSEWNIRYQEGYDHSYFFIATFIADHIKHHANVLVK
jgi:S-formylglutathione hydrolase